MMSMEQLRNIEAMIGKAQMAVQDVPGTRVTVVCGGGAVVSGDWIESDGRRETASVVVYDEVDGAVTTTRLDIESVAGVGTTVPSMALVHEGTRVPPSRRTMTIASILFQVWGRIQHVPTYGDLRRALDDIDGSGAGLAGSREIDAKPIDGIHEGMLGQVEKVLLQIAVNGASKHLVDYLDGMPIAEVMADDRLRAAVLEDTPLKEAIAQEMRGWSADAGVEDAQSDLPRGLTLVKDLKGDLRNRAVARMSLATARKDLERAYHPFVERGRLASFARGR